MSPSQAAGQDDQGASAQQKCAESISEAPFAMPVRLAPASEAGPNGEDNGGSEGSGTPFPRLPSGSGRSSSGWDPSMIAIAAPLAQGAEPVLACSGIK